MANLDGTQSTIPDAVDRLLSARDTIRANFAAMGLADTSADLPALAAASFEVLTGFNNKADKSLGLWGFTAIPANSDLNDYTACGYYCHGLDSTVSTLANCPVSKAFTMKVFSATGDSSYDTLLGDHWHYRVQRITTIYGDEYVRYAYADNTDTVIFGAWKSVLYAESALSTLGISSGSWTPTVSGMSSYTYQNGRLFKIGDIAIVSFAFWGEMAGSTTSRITVSGCPLVPTGSTYGGGDLSGYYSGNNVFFTGWEYKSDGNFYALGQEISSGEKWHSSAIYQKTSGGCGGGGTIMFKPSN